MPTDSLVNNIAHIKQAVVFDGMNVEDWRNVTPSDLDAVYDLGGKASIIFELKKRGGSLKVGQRILLERWAEKLPYCVVFLCYHDVESPSPILLNSCIVDKIYYQGKWIDDSEKQRTARQALDDYLSFLKKEKINP